MTVEVKTETQSPEFWVNTTTDPLLDLRKEVAKKYVDDLKQKTGIWASLIVGEGKKLTDYLVAEWTEDRTADTAGLAILTGLLNGLETKTFDLDGQKYDIQNYLLRVKNKINRSTEEQLQLLKTNIGTSAVGQETTPSATTPNTAPTTTPDTERKNIDVAGRNYEYPVPGVKINSPYGPRWGKLHQGIDIAAAKWTNILSIGRGVVESVGFGSDSAWFNGYGNYVVVRLDNWYRVLYGHMRKRSPLKVGEEITAWAPIWLMGNTWTSTWPHLHLEIRKWETDDEVNFFKRTSIDPLNVLPVSEDMIVPDILARVDQKLLVPKDSNKVKNEDVTALK